MQLLTQLLMQLLTQLLTQELQRSIPPLYSQEQTDDPAVVCAFFLPATNRTWYVLEGATREPEGCGFGQNCDHRPLSEYDPARDDVLFSGYVVGDEAELGYFSLSELTRIRGPFGRGWSGIATLSPAGCLS